jgi:hypothetical protein
MAVRSEAAVTCRECRFVRQAWLLLSWLLLLSLVCAPAAAGEFSKQVAIDAFSVRNEHCADVGVTDVTLHATSVSAVAPAWARVSEVYEAEGESFLLYWRGVLAQCLAYDGKARADLEAFLEIFADDPVHKALVLDAQQRVRRLSVGFSPRRAVTAPALVLGVGLGVGAGVLAALSVTQGATVLSIQEDLETKQHLRNPDPGEESISELENRGTQLALSTNVTLASAIACAVSSGISLAVYGAQKKAASRAGRSEHRLPILAAAVDPHGGLAVGVTVRW